MTLPYSDPSNPALPSPLFSDITAVRSDHMRANNAAIFADLEFLDENAPPLVALTGGSFKTAALANANTYNGRSLYTCTAGVADTPYTGVWRVFGTWNPTESSGRFVAMLDSSLETWEINYSSGVWGTWTKHIDSYNNHFANAFNSGYNTTATSGGTLTLDVSSAAIQFFTGSSSHAVTLPVVSTLTLGRTFSLTNTGTGVISVNSSGGNLVAYIPPATTRQFICILITGTSAASWFASYDNLPVGVIYPYTGITAPAWGLFADGSSLARTDFAALFAAITSTQTCTMSSAAPCIVTANGHGLKTGSRISFETTGSLPTGLSHGTNFYVIYIDADTFNVATTYANALAGTKITTTGAQSGTHTLRNNPWGVADINHFNIPDLRGVFLKGAGVQGYSAWAAAAYVGILGEYFQDRNQAWQLGSAADASGARNYYGFADVRDYAVVDTHHANFAPLQMGTAYQGNTSRLKAMNDGTNGDPRQGLTTEPASAGVNYVIRY